MTPEMQRLQDLLAAVQAHRNQVLDAHAALQADIAALKRILAEREDQIKALKEEVANLKQAEQKAA